MAEETTVLLPSVRPDGAFLHFLKELPSWVVLLILFGGVLTVYQFQRDDFLPRILDAVLGGLLTTLISNRPRAAATTTNIDTVTTDSVNTETMPDATVNTETMNLKEKKDEI